MKELVELSQNFNLLYFLENLDDYVQIMNLDLQVIWCNSAAKKISEPSGVLFEEGIDLFDWLPFLSPEKDKIINEYQNVINNKEKLITTEISLVKDIPIYTKTIKIPVISDNQVKYIITILYDQTPLITSFKNITSERDMLFTIFDSINEIIYVTDIDTYEILYINPFFLKILEQKTGLKWDEIRQNKCYKIFQDLDSPCPFCTNEIIKNQPGEPYRWQFHNSFLDIHLLITDRLVNWINGKPVRFEIAIDISDEFKIQEELQSTIQKLEISNQMLDDFAHVISHDLREPLRTVVNFLSMIKEESDKKVGITKGEDETSKLIIKAYDNSLRMQKMINELLLLSKLNQDTTFDTIKIDVKKLINDIIKDIEIKIQETGAIIEIEENIEDIYGEFQLIRQIFLNIICNAINARNPEKHPLIKINSEKKDNEVLYILEDNGIGMSQEQIAKIFQPQDVWHKPVTLKSGMGLEICKRVIALHHGNIYAKSDGINGTTLYFSIPNQKDE